MRLLHRANQPNKMSLDWMFYYFRRCRVDFELWMLNGRKHDKRLNANAIVNHEWSKYCDRLLWPRALMLPHNRQKADQESDEENAKEDEPKFPTSNRMSSRRALTRQLHGANWKCSNCLNTASSSNNMIELTSKLDKRKNRDENHVMR